MSMTKFIFNIFVVFWINGFVGSGLLAEPEAEVAALIEQPQFTDEQYAELTAAVEEADAEATAVSADEPINVEKVMSEPASRGSRLVDSLIRGSLVFGAATVNLVKDPTNPLPAFNAAAIGFFGGTGSGVMQYFNAWYMAYISNAAVARALGVKNPRLASSMNEIEKILRGFSADYVYVSFTNLGVVIFSPGTLPNISSYFFTTFVTAMAGVVAQSIPEVGFADQVRSMKAAYPQRAKWIQFFADKVTAGWSIATSAAQVGLVMGASGSKNILIGLTVVGVTNYLVNLLFKYRHKDLPPQESIKAQRGLLARVIGLRPRCAQEIFANGAKN